MRTRDRVVVMRRYALALLVVWLAAPAAAELVAGGAARVVEVIDGDTVVLDTGEQLRMVGIQAPKLPLGRSKFATWPLAGEAKGALEALALDRMVTLSFGGRRIDRHGRLLAQLHRADGLWLQGEMLRLGLARVYSFRDNRTLVPEMLALEAAARGARRGIWAHRFYAVRRAEPGAVPYDGFELVVGRVLDVAERRARTYLNFGADWKTDFTVSIATRHRRLFEREGWDLAALKDRLVRVRGWVKRFNGPLIEVTHPEQIEVIEE